MIQPFRRKSNTNVPALLAIRSHIEEWVVRALAAHGFTLWSINQRGVAWAAGWLLRARDARPLSAGGGAPRLDIASLTALGEGVAEEMAILFLASQGVDVIEMTDCALLQVWAEALRTAQGEVATQ